MYIKMYECDCFYCYNLIHLKVFGIHSIQIKGVYGFEPLLCQRSDLKQRPATLAYSDSFTSYDRSLHKDTTQYFSPSLLCLFPNALSSYSRRTPPPPVPDLKENLDSLHTPATSKVSHRCSNKLKNEEMCVVILPQTLTRQHRSSVVPVIAKKEEESANKSNRIYASRICSAYATSLTLTAIMSSRSRKFSRVSLFLIAQLCLLVHCQQRKDDLGDCMSSVLDLTCFIPHRSLLHPAVPQVRPECRRVSEDVRK